MTYDQSINCSINELTTEGEGELVLLAFGGLSGATATFSDSQCLGLSYMGSVPRGSCVIPLTFLGSAPKLGSDGLIVHMSSDCTVEMPSVPHLGPPGPTTVAAGRWSLLCLQGHLVTPEARSCAGGDLKCRCLGT